MSRICLACSTTLTLSDYVCPHCGMEVSVHQPVPPASYPKTSPTVDIDEIRAAIQDKKADKQKTIISLLALASIVVVAFGGAANYFLGKYRKNVAQEQQIKAEFAQQKRADAEAQVRMAEANRQSLLLAQRKKKEGEQQSALQGRLSRQQNRENTQVNTWEQQQSIQQGNAQAQAAEEYQQAQLSQRRQAEADNIIRHSEQIARNAYEDARRHKNDIGTYDFSQPMLTINACRHNISQAVNDASPAMQQVGRQLDLIMLRAVNGVANMSSSPEITPESFDELYR
jgi:hypothetical protein